MIILLPLLICLIGLVMFFVSTNAKVSTIGSQMFWVGLLAFLLTYHGQAITVVR